MNCVLAMMLLPLHFTAPANAPMVDAAGQARASILPVRAYVFYELDANGTLAAIPGYADSAGKSCLAPHAPGTRETVWLAPGGSRTASTVYIMSLGANGGLSSPSNASVIGRRTVPDAVSARRTCWTTLDVPVVRQTREHCGQASLSMVLRYYGAAPAALREVDGAYDPALHGSLITDLAGAARRAGYDAVVVRLDADSLIGLINDGVPAILLYQSGSGPLTVRHYGVVSGWDATHASFRLHDGSARPRVMPRAELVKRWETAGSQALVVRQRAAWAAR